jgi:hypothetical protein
VNGPRSPGETVNYLIDTNIVSELRKGSRCHPNVSAWFAALAPDKIVSRNVRDIVRTGVRFVNLFESVIHPDAV